MVICSPKSPPCSIGRETRVSLQPLLKFYFLTFKLHNNTEHFGKCKQIRGKFKNFIILPLPGEMAFQCGNVYMNMQIYFGVSAVSGFVVFSITRNFFAHSPSILPQVSPRTCVDWDSPIILWADFSCPAGYSFYGEHHRRECHPALFVYLTSVLALVT